MDDWKGQKIAKKKHSNTCIKFPGNVQPIEASIVRELLLQTKNHITTLLYEISTTWIIIQFIIFDIYLRSNSKVDGMKENAAENWLASLTSKIVSVPDNESIQGFTGYNYIWVPKRKHKHTRKQILDRMSKIYIWG